LALFKRVYLNKELKTNLNNSVFCVLSVVVAGVTGAVVTTSATPAFCFVKILFEKKNLSFPYKEKLR